MTVTISTTVDVVPGRVIEAISVVVAVIVIVGVVAIQEHAEEINEGAICTRNE
jgi:hypothetical protein